MTMPRKFSLKARLPPTQPRQINIAFESVRLRGMSADLLPATVLKRKAVLYVRQPTQTQVQTNLESQRRQYDLVEEARRRGFVNIELIDDDLGRSASGTVARPGFDRLVAWLCAGEVGAVLCFDASRLARNGRDWHHLLELCGLVEARGFSPVAVAPWQIVQKVTDASTGTSVKNGFVASVCCADQILKANPLLPLTLKSPGPKS